MQIRIARGRHWIRLGYLSAMLLGAVPAAGHAQLPVSANTPACIAETAGPNLGLLPSQQPVGTFQPTCGQMLSPHYNEFGNDVILIDLGNGQVLVAGGSAPILGHPDIEDSTPKAELYDTRLGVFLPVRDMAVERPDPRYVLLGNGEVLIAYGAEDDFSDLSSDASEVFQPALLGFAKVGPFATRRFGGSFSLNAFGSGNALLAGGYVPGTILKNAEVYQPDSHSYTATGSLHTARAYHTGVALRDGRILVAGGFVETDRIPSVATATAEIYNPATGKFKPTGSMITARASAYGILLNDGRVLFVAGGTCWLASSCYLTSAEIYDPATGSFSPTGALLRPLPSCCRAQPFLMKNGKVLLGDEIYDPVTGTFSLAPGQQPPPDWTYAIGIVTQLLGTGQVLWLGVIDSTAALLYQPPP